MTGGRWIRLQADAPVSAKLVGLSSDAARWAYVATLCAATHQRPEGRWVSERHYRACLPGSVARHLPELKEAGLLEVVDGRLEVHDWGRYQMASGADRQRRYRETHRDVTRDVTSDAGRDAERDGQSDGRNAPTIRDETIRDEGAPQPPSDDQDDGRVAYFEVTGRYPSSSNLSAWVDRLAADFGSDAFRAALATEHMADPSTRTLLSRTESRMAMDRDRRERRERAAKQREGRKPVAPLRAKEPEPELTQEEIDRQVAQYRAGIKAEGGAAHAG